MDSKSYLQKLIFCVFFSVLSIIGAFIMIPLPLSPVPITLQTLFVLMSGALLGPAFGALSQVIYIFLGVMGLPVFAGFSAGPFVLIGPTGGYLVGFVAGSFLVGLLCRFFNKINLYVYFFVFALGTIVIYVFGCMGLMFFMHIGFKKAVFIGIFPFVIGDTLKMTLASFLALRLKGKVF